MAIHLGPIYLCSICGYAPGNRRNWCNAGCGSDYRKMIPVEIVGREVVKPELEAGEGPAT